MRSIGMDLEPLERQGLLHMHGTRPTLFGLEMHLAQLNRLIHEVQPTAVVIDPVSNLDQAGTNASAGNALLRMVDLLRQQGITTYLTHLTSARDPLESTVIGISSMVDTWLLLRHTETSGERNRTLYVLKSRGMAHSNQVREFLLGENGIQLVEAYIGPDGVLTGSARVAQQAREQAASLVRQQQISLGRRELERKRQALNAKVAALEAEFAAEAEELERNLSQQIAVEAQLEADRLNIARSRHVRRIIPGNGSQNDGGEV